MLEHPANGRHAAHIIEQTLDGKGDFEMAAIRFFPELAIQSPTVPSSERMAL